MVPQLLSISRLSANASGTGPLTFSNDGSKPISSTFFRLLLVASDLTPKNNDFLYELVLIRVNKATLGNAILRLHSDFRREYLVHS